MIVGHTDLQLMLIWQRISNLCSICNERFVCSWRLLRHRVNHQQHGESGCHLTQPDGEGIASLSIVT